MTEVSWTVLHVAQRADEVDPDFEPFCYTIGLVEHEQRPNVWLSYVGECGHRLGMQMAHAIANEAAFRLIDGTLEVGRGWEERTEADASIYVAFGEAFVEEQRIKAQAFPDDGGPVHPLRWTCSLDEP